MMLFMYRNVGGCMHIMENMLITSKTVVEDSFVAPQWNEMF